MTLSLLGNSSSLPSSSSASSSSASSVFIPPEDPTATFFAAATALQTPGGATLVDARAAAAALAARRGQGIQLPTTVAPWRNDQISEEDFFASLPVFDMFPLSNGDENHVILYALLYAILFLVGVCGNVSVITLIRHLHANTSYDNTMIYVLFLCCVDLASVVPLPMAIMDQLLGFWMFGTALCKVYRALEHVGRALSTFVLAAMAFDRFLRVCYPHRKTTRRLVLVQLFVLTLFTFVLLSPLLIKSSSKEIVLKEVLLENPYRLARVRIFKCMDHLEGTLLSVFISYMFTVGFFLPVLLIILFYALMMRRLFQRSRSLSSSKLPVNRIAGYTIAISAFFVLCWSPYWISMLYFNFMHWDSEDPDRNEDIFSSDKFIYIMYGIHALPYVNSASNWLLYGLLNSQLMRRAKYTGESTLYAAGMAENVYTGGVRQASTNNFGTPPQQSITFRLGSTTSTAQGHNSLTVVTSGRCNSTLSAPLIGGGGKNHISLLSNGGPLLSQCRPCPPSPSASIRSISTVSAPPHAICPEEDSGAGDADADSEARVRLLPAGTGVGGADPYSSADVLL